MRGRAKAVRLAWLVALVRLAGKMRMAELVARLFVHDLTTVNRDDEIVSPLVQRRTMLYRREKSRPIPFRDRLLFVHNIPTLSP